MRMMIDFDDTLYKKVKVGAAMNGLSMKEFISRAVEHELETSGTGFERRRIRLPLVPSKNPGSLVLRPDDIAAVLEQED